VRKNQGIWNSFTTVPNLTDLVLRTDRHFLLTFWHRNFTFNSNKSKTWCNNFSV